MRGYGSFLERRIPYTVPETAWREELGNHRAVLEITEAAGAHIAVAAVIPWRRRDDHPEDKRIIVTDALTGSAAENVLRLEITQEVGVIAFSPVKGAREYHVYYMPYETQGGHGFYDKGYYGPEKRPHLLWRLKVRTAARSAVHGTDAGGEGRSGPVAVAEVKEFQSRTDFDGFYPMEVPSTEMETLELIGRYRERYLVFTEDRRFPIRMTDAIPRRWAEAGCTGRFEGEARPNEYYAIQIGLFASAGPVEDVRLGYSDLVHEDGRSVIAAGAFTCFNLEGTDIDGAPMTKRVDVGKGRVQALWIGLDIPGNAVEGSYEGTVKVTVKDLPSQVVALAVTVTGPPISDRGDGEPWRHSRLRWLNSTLGSEPAVFAPFSPLRIEDGGIVYAGRRLGLNADGLPSEIVHGNRSLLSGPFELSAGDGLIDHRCEFTRREEGRIEWTAVSSGGSVDRRVTASTDPDGYISYSVVLTARENCRLEDIVLGIPVDRSRARYFMGMEKGGGRLEPYRWDWKGPGNSFWVGDHSVGLHVKLLGAPYSGPLMNLYHPDPPESWYNGGSGSFEIVTESAERAVLSVRTGPREMTAGEKLELRFALILTPVKELDPGRHFSTRYFHHIEPGKEEADAGVNVVNVHHANRVNPFINYPFIATGEMKSFVDGMRERGIKTKIYYTVREMTYRITELWAFRSLGDEIFATRRRDQWGKAWRNAYPWLREHLREDFVPQWYSVLDDGTVDVAILTSGESRFYNYYIEGLAWLVDNIGIDGLYLDDVSFDRRIVRRMRAVLEKRKPGACLIDLHSNTAFSKGPAVKYTDFFPYVDKLWFGESFRYDEMPPDQWLVECSGIPFGLMGDMLQDGGNRWRGMLFGMTNRPPHNPGVSPYPVWRIWDEFGIAGSKMVGFWEDGCPVRTDNPDVPATVYLAKGRALVALASWADRTVRVRLEIDWDAVGLSGERAVLRGPAIEGFQEPVEIRPGGTVTVEPKRGLLLYIE